MRHHNEPQQSIRYRSHLICSSLPARDGFPGNAHHLCEVVPRETDMLPQETNLDRRQHSLLQHNLMSDGAMQLRDAGNGNRLTSTCGASNHIDAVEFNVW